MKTETKAKTYREAHLIKCDDSVEIIRLDKAETLEQLQGWVGGLIQRVRVRYAGKVRDMWVNEEGFLLRLPYNHSATGMLTTESIEVRIRMAEKGYGGYIAGVGVIIVIQKEEK